MNRISTLALVAALGLAMPAIAQSPAALRDSPFMVQEAVKNMHQHSDMSDEAHDKKVTKKAKKKHRKKQSEAVKEEKKEHHDSMKKEKKAN